MTSARIEPRSFVLAAVFIALFGSCTLAGMQAPSPPPPPPVQLPEISTPHEEAMVDVGGRKLHALRYGKGSPTVVLVSGFRAPQKYWNPVVPALAEVATVVTYDRPGIGKSELGSGPNHGAQAAADLRRLLEALAVPKPYVVVGHSYGGRIARLFASSFPTEVAGLVLEDSSHEDREQLVAMSAGFRQRVPNPSTEAEFMLDTIEQLRASRPLPRVPFVVLAAIDSFGLPPEFSAEGVARIKKVNARMQRRIAGLVEGATLVGVPDVGHNIHIDKPRALLDPLLAIVAEVQSAAFTYSGKR
jgi:pimeloyl-ACP methyl ester carboxylesterase